MSFLLREVAHCDVCGHEWITDKVPVHCAKCKTRKWNQGSGAPRKSIAPVEILAPIRTHAQTCKCMVCRPPKGDA